VRAMLTAHAHGRGQSVGYSGWRCRSCGARLPTGHCKACYAKAHPESLKLARRRLRAEGRQKCARCRRELPLTQFHRRTDRNGYGSACRACSAATQQPKRYTGVCVSVERRRELVALGQRYCPGCKSDRPTEAFGRAPNRPAGVDAYCKSCRNARRRARYAAGPVTGRARSRENYYRSVGGWGRDVRARSAHSAVAHAAHEAVHRALKRGTLVRPDACSLCDGTEFAIHAHHDDYDRALDVIWLCVPCHKLCHGLHDAEQRKISLPAGKPSGFLPEVLKLRRTP